MLREALAPTLRHLKELAPALVPIRVYFRDLGPEEAYGTTRLASDRHGKPKHFVITIDERLPKYVAKMILIHEWAHAISWFSGGDDHGPEWGVSFSRLYQLVYED